MSNFQENVSLSEFTSFGVGGPAEYLTIANNSTETINALLSTPTSSEVWLLGSGSNVLISDYGLPGYTIVNKGGVITVEDTNLIVDAGADWDEVVKTSIDHGLWGIELLSRVPGTVGGALFINITAYGQSIADVVEWIEVWNRNTKRVEKIKSAALKWDYKKSIFQLHENSRFVILRSKLSLSKSKTTDIKYQKAIDVAKEIGIDTNTLANRRTVIIEARKRAGSLLENNGHKSRTVGSFFRNPIVTPEQVDVIAAYDESEKSLEQIKLMNKTHGGVINRVSAAHVMLAAGFKRGQTWNNKVKLNDYNLLKIEALEGATAQDIYRVKSKVQEECLEKLGVHLEPEVQILGKF